MKYICLLDNPVSGPTIHTSGIETLCSLLETEGYRLEKYTLTSFEKTEQVVKEQIQDGCELFIVAGGDGTVRSVAQYLKNTNVPLLIFPLGNENLLANHFQLSRDPLKTMEVIERGEIRRIDVIDINGIICTAVAGIGVDGTIVHNVHRNRNGHISRLNYVWPTIKTILTYRHRHVRVSIDNKLICDSKAIVFMGNISRYGGGFKIFKNTLCDDGLLDIVIFRCENLFQLIYLFILSVIGLTGMSRLVSRYQGRHVEISSSASDMYFQIDGDPGPSLPLEANIIPGGLSLLVPHT